MRNKFKILHGILDHHKDRNCQRKTGKCHTSSPSGNLSLKTIRESPAHSESSWSLFQDQIHFTHRVLLKHKEKMKRVSFTVVCYGSWTMCQQIPFLVMKLLPDSGLRSVPRMYRVNCWRILCSHCNWGYLVGTLLYALHQEKTVSFLRLSTKTNVHKIQPLQHIKLLNLCTYRLLHHICNLSLKATQS